jgi:phospholipid/cholesterol/gamma-HCH transport system permease protein
MSEFRIATETGQEGARLVRIEGALSRKTVGLLKRAVPPGGEGVRVEIDLSGVTGFDSFGAVFLLEIAALSRGPFIVTGASEDLKDFVRRLARFKGKAGKREKGHSLLEWLGQIAIDVLAGVRAFLILTLEFFYWLGVAPFKRGRRLYTERTFGEIVAAGVEAIPIVLLVSLLMGVILALNSSYQLERFGVSILVADLVGIAQTKEIGPLFTAILVAGRTGSSIAAELGTMVVTEEIDALEVMGINPRAFLIVPKIVALVLVMPCLVIMADILGICGGLLIGVSRLNLSFLDYFNETLEAVQFSDVLTGLIKSAVFGLLIGLTGATLGLRLKGGAEEVGRITTASVVISFFLIIFADTVFTLFFTHIGY